MNIRRYLVSTAERRQYRPFFTKFKSTNVNLLSCLVCLLDKNGRFSIMIGQIACQSNSRQRVSVLSPDNCTKLHGLFPKFMQIFKVLRTRFDSPHQNMNSSKTDPWLSLSDIDRGGKSTKIFYSSKSTITLLKFYLSTSKSTSLKIYSSKSKK